MFVATIVLAQTKGSFVQIGVDKLVERQTKIVLLLNSLKLHKETKRELKIPMFLFSLQQITKKLELAKRLIGFAFLVEFGRFAKM